MATKASRADTAAPCGPWVPSDGEIDELTSSPAAGPRQRSLPLVHAPVAPSSVIGKVALFRALFRGREDVFPKLWINRKTGVKGYSPVCANEWRPSACEKPRIRCGACQHLSLRPGREPRGALSLTPGHWCRVALLSAALVTSSSRTLRRLIDERRALAHLEAERESTRGALSEQSRALHSGA